MTDNTKTILVVDDDPDARDYISTVLQDNDYAVVTACDGSEALTQLQQMTPALVTLDITMPEKSGVSVYRKLKEEEQYQGIPVIIITGMSDDFQKFISTRRQVPPPEGYINKPVDAQQFMTMVEQLLA